ncbi:hypothetical protein CLU83_1126 [Flavobacterium sp. 1]|uniref:hypothetical protein n=1 Tax=Flavobacterium sp. 1 TaxID=2035200 RepID=UPI000C249EF1|nr:hypothetical protein [Flavobacterium sp. 1]PJJ07913.1 hypothetical protein CLU83_1126 [Flavobacterium sp. 1]
MKNSVLILGIALVSFSNICNAKNSLSFQYNLFQNTILSSETEIQNDGTAKFAKPSLAEEAEVFNPETVIAFSRKTVKEIIEEGDKIVETRVLNNSEFMAYEESMKEIIAQSELTIESNVSNETHPLYSERTIEDEIAELELIIESNSSNEVSPLDFKKNDSNSIMTNTFNSKKFIGMN